MAQKVQVALVSDIDEAPADETVSFSLDGTDYEIDLSTGQAQEMRQGLAEFVAHARKAPRRRRNGGLRKGRSTRSDLPDIREFARARGYPINDRGRVPGRIISEYDELRRLSSK